MESLDTILNTAVPASAAALEAAPLSTKAVLCSYAVSLAVFIPVRSYIEALRNCEVLPLRES
jgi:hypothetical protein